MIARWLDYFGKLERLNFSDWTSFRQKVQSIIFVESNKQFSKKHHNLSVWKHSNVQSEFLILNKISYCSDVRKRNSVVCTIRVYTSMYTLLSWWSLGGLITDWCQYIFPEFCMVHKVHIFWEGHKILRNLHHRFDCHYIGQI